MSKNKIDKKKAEKIRNSMSTKKNDKNDKHKEKVKKEHNKNSFTVKIKRFFSKKLTLVSIGVCVVFTGITGKMAYEMLINGPKYKALAEDQWMREREISPKRGNILDRNGIQLAKSIQVYRVDLDLDTIRKYSEREEISIPDIAKLISETIDFNYEEVLNKLELKDEEGNPAKFSTLTRSLEKEYAEKLGELNIYGVVIDYDTKRYYPNNNFLSHVLGSTNLDGIGLTGLELYYDEYLSGTPGLKIAGVDAIGQDLPYVKKTVIEPVDGNDIILTIDENIQYFAEKIAEKAYDEHKAKRVSILISDPNTGEILAMTNKPDFNPNSPYEGFEDFDGEDDSEKIQSMWRNWLVNDGFEAGSTFKNITMSAAIEEGLTYESETFVCNGYTQFGSHKVHCWQTWGHGAQTLPEILKNSCNVGFMELGKRLGPEKLNEYIYKFGFGEQTGIDLPGEAEGIVKEAKNMPDIDLATISFGQTNLVTAMQLSASFNAIVNGGNLITPHILKEVTHIDKESGITVVDEEFTPKISRGIISETTSNTMKRYLQFTADDKDKTNTYVEGYSVGIKSGTGQKVDVEFGGYSSTKYLGSMVAVAPIENPEFTIYMAVDEPSTGVYYGGQVITPYMKELIKEIFTYKESAKNDSDIQNLMIPDLRSLSKEEALEKISDLGINYEIIGEGETVTNILPLPGNIVKSNSKIKIITDGETISTDIAMPNLTGKEKSECLEILNLLNLSAVFEGYGIVEEQSIKKGEIINTSSEINILLSPKEVE